ncbi:carboxypeptidase N subunit 2 [Caerostris extrusa]|uniref:Carboxypeptidase N subunit 2 n=1 Tax=Caerostris extrusa TaxID=172846 RepID=A0AAV4WM56_CAEEX|nr:carboxypeptidase N subunit 2 [Caerostris extrusa]
MKFVAACCFMCIQIAAVIGKKALCPSSTACECNGSNGRVFVNCLRVANISQLRDVFGKHLNYAPVYIFRLKQCKAKFLPSPVFFNTTIRDVRTDCPFDRMDNNSLSSINSLKILSLYSSDFSRIPKAIGDLANLKQLLINDGRLYTLDTELQNMTQLRKIKLIHNHLRLVSNEAFLGNPNLRIVDLSHNKLVYLYPETFNKCRELTRVFLRKNFLKSIDGLFNNPNLIEINLRSNNLKSIDEAFQQEIKLEILDISENALHEVSESALNSNVKRLRILSMAHCQLNFLRAKIFHLLNKLEKIDLSFNKLESIPLEVFRNLHNLVEVDLRENKITYLNDVFIQNYRLEAVFLSDNNLRSINNLFRGLEYLSIVDLKSNKLQAITSEDFSTTPSLQSLRLTKNNINRIDFEAFTNLPELKNLTLDYNRLESLNGSLRDLRSLEILFLHGNKLRKIREFDMRNLRNLKRLNLRANNISSIHGAFRNQINLEVLTISENSLTTLSRITFPRNFRIKKLNVGANKWICDCRLLWILELKATRDLANLNDNCPNSCDCTCVAKEDQFFVRVDCSNRNLLQVPPVLPAQVGELHLQNNNLTSHLDLDIHSLEQLRYLNLEQNFLNEIDFYLPKNLRILKLAENKLTRFPSYFPKSISTWTLSGNPWICDCETIVDVNSTKCSYSEEKPELYGKIIHELTEYELCPEKLSLYIFLGVGLSVLTLSAIGSHLVYTRTDTT